MNKSTNRVKPSFPMPATRREGRRERETREIDALNGLRRVFRSLQFLQERHRLFVRMELVYTMRPRSRTHSVLAFPPSKLRLEHHSHSHHQQHHQHQHYYYHHLLLLLIVCDIRSVASADSNSLPESLLTPPYRFHRRVRLRLPPLSEPFRIRPLARSTAAAFAGSAFRALGAVERAAESGSAAAIASAHRSRACRATANTRGWE